MEEKIKALKEQMEAALGHVDSKEQLAEFWQNFLGKKGSIADLMKGLGSVPKEERPNIGKTINEFKNQVEARYQEMKNRMDELELAARNKSEQVGFMSARVSLLIICFVCGVNGQCRET